MNTPRPTKRWCNSRHDRPVDAHNGCKLLAGEGSTTGHEDEEQEPGEEEMEEEEQPSTTLDEVEPVHNRHTHSNDRVDAAQQGRSTWDRGTTLLRTIPSLSTHQTKSCMPCTVQARARPAPYECGLGYDASFPVPHQSRCPEWYALTVRGPATRPRQPRERRRNRSSRRCGLHRHSTPTRCQRS